MQPDPCAPAAPAPAYPPLPPPGAIEATIAALAALPDMHCVAWDAGRQRIGWRTTGTWHRWITAGVRWGTVYRAADGWYERGWCWDSKNYGANKRAVRDALWRFR